MTSQELREQGDWLILYAVELETVRFVHGGTRIIDNRAFKDRMGSFILTSGGKRFVVPEVGGCGVVRRSAADWGWQLMCAKGFLRIASFDRCRGVSMHAGALKSDIRGQPWRPKPLTSALMHLPENGLYDAHLCPAVQQLS